MTQLSDRPDVIDRFTAPLYGLAEAARYLDVPESTFATWARGYSRHPRGRSPVLGAPVLTAVKARSHRGPVVPFIGLAEGLTLAAIRRAGVPLQRIRPVLERLSQEFGLEHALAAKRLFTDGAEVLFDYAEGVDDPEAAQAARRLVTVRHGQRVLQGVVDQYLRLLEYGEDGYPHLIHLPAYVAADVVVDPTRGFGQPIFAKGGARLEDALSLFRAGEPLEVVADEYGVPPEELQDAVRIAIRVAA